MDLKNLLNKEQFEAATTVDGQVLILAGAGSGKTRVLTHRIAYMLEDKGVNPYNILAITFTNKAAAEMRERVKLLVGEQADRMWISTFHSTCVRILRREIEKLGYKKDFTIYDSSDQKTVVKHVVKELQISDKDISENEIIGSIGKAKDNLQSPSAYMRECEGHYRKEKIAKAYELYQKKLKNNNALDFDDLIFKTVELFKNHEDVLDFYQNKFKYIMIDEYQDTNKAQYEFARLLAAKHKNICVVGDDDQCLIEGTPIETEKGFKNIENLEETDLVRVASGYGESTYEKIDEIKLKDYKGKVTTIKTESGKTITATVNHIIFAKQEVEKNKYYVYLMYKDSMGFRIGQTSSVRSRKGELASGLAVKLNGEQGDKIWIIKACDNKEDASYYEEYYSYKYGIPKMVFNSRGRGITLSQEKIEQLFKEIDTKSSAERLMEDEHLYIEYPHHVSSAIIRGNSIRKRINVTFYGGKKSLQKASYSHRIGLNSSGEEYKNKFIEAGFNVRDGQRNTFRVETERADYNEAESFSRKLRDVEDAYEIERRAKLSENKSFKFMPIGSIKVGMIVAIYNGEKVIEDKVIEVNKEDYEGKVYDLNIKTTRNYIANNVVVHNCIYAWRGADIRNILDFEKDYPEAKVVKLEQNYRSMGNILEAANKVIKNNAERKSKVLRTTKESGNKISIHRAYSDKMEAAFIANEIKKLREDNPWDYRDFAILYRTNAQSRTFEESLRRASIPYRIFGGLKFYDRKEIKDILAYLKVIVNPQDDVSLRRIINVPKRSIGDATVDKLQDFANSQEMSLYDAVLEAEYVPGLTARSRNPLMKFAEMMEDIIVQSANLKVSELIEYVLDKTGYMKALKESKLIEDESRVENLEELVSDAVDFEKNREFEIKSGEITFEDGSPLSSYLEKVALVQDTDNIDSENNYVMMMTVHSSKGLEFPVVYMVGMENGIFPSGICFDKDDQMEEARRLCYVGITRAEEKLYMTSAESRMVFGKTVAYPQSDFVQEIPVELKEFVGGGRANQMASKERKSYGAFSTSTMNDNHHGLRISAGFVTKGKAAQDLNQIINKNTATNKLTKEDAVPGRKVKHNKFGVGTIINVSPIGDDLKLTIAFTNQGVKQLMLAVAPLELV
ncbi:MAG: UvrD-helicase domain-containing protein [Sarcina sp.]